MKDEQVARVEVGAVPFGGGEGFSLIAGPCVMQGRDHVLRHADAVAAACRAVGVPLVFKSSFDKANRTSGASFRGPGIDEGLAILAVGGLGDLSCWAATPSTLS